MFEDDVRVRRSVRHFLEGGDLADYLIFARAQAAGCTALASFDQALEKRLPEFVLVPE